MKVAFGFFLEGLRSSGLTNPEASFVSASIKKWLKNPGEYIAEGDLLAEIETDKIDTFLVSPCTGVLSSVRYNNGDEWEVGVTRNGVELESRMHNAVLGQLLLPELGYIDMPNEGEGEIAGSRMLDELITVEEGAESTRIPSLRVGKPVDSIGEPNDIAESERVRAAPLARRLADEAGIDINTVSATGSGGRVMREDVERSIVERESVNESEPKASLPDRTSLNASQMRKTIARYMQRSHEEIPRAGDSITIDVTHLLAFYRNRREIWREDTGTDFSFTGIFMFLAVKLLSQQREKFGIINGYWDKDENDGFFFSHVNIGIALQGPDGLLVPVIHSAEELRFRELMQAVHDKIQRAGEKKITLSELHDLTFTVNNVGAMGGENPDSIVPYTKESSGKERPTGMIMVLGAIKPYPDNHLVEALLDNYLAKRVEDFPVRYFINLAFKFDHRLFDGVPALEFVNTIKRYVERKTSPEEFSELFRDDFAI